MDMYNSKNGNKLYRAEKSWRTIQSRQYRQFMPTHPPGAYGAPLQGMSCE
jgi:hypothetical protein